MKPIHYLLFKNWTLVLCYVIYSEDKNTSGCSVSGCTNTRTNIKYLHTYINASDAAWGPQITLIWLGEGHLCLIEPNGTNQTAVLHVGDRK